MVLAVGYRLQVFKLGNVVSSDPVFSQSLLNRDSRVPVDWPGLEPGTLK
jgi:hypothetical protein